MSYLNKYYVKLEKNKVHSIFSVFVILTLTNLCKTQAASYYYLASLVLNQLQVKIKCNNNFTSASILTYLL